MIKYIKNSIVADIPLRGVRPLKDYPVHIDIDNVIMGGQSRF